MLVYTFWESDIRLTSLNSESKFAKNPCEYPVTSHPNQYLLGMLFASKEDLGKDLKDLDIGDDSLPLQHSLGLTWNLTQLGVSAIDKQGVLSNIAHIFYQLDIYLVNARISTMGNLSELYRLFSV
jgi:hypothetical protein